MRCEDWRECESSDNLVPSEKALSMLISDSRDMCKGSLAPCASSADLISSENPLSKSFSSKNILEISMQSSLLGDIPKLL